MKYFDWRDFWAIMHGLFKNRTATFEEKFAEYIGCKYAVATSFGRTALYLGLRAIGVEQHEVIIPSFTCTVVRQAVVAAGAKPRFVDIDDQTFAFKLDDLRKNITPTTKAIVLTHYFGCVANNFDEVIKIASDNKLFLVEDCAHSLGAIYKGHKIGTFGHFSIFSLTKNTINFGGGVLATNNETIEKKVRQIMLDESISFKKRIVDFPLIFAYGLEQFIDKIFLDRVKSNVLNNWFINIPNFILQIRSALIKIIKIPVRILRFKKTSFQPPIKPQRMLIGLPPMPYEQGLHMEPIISALGCSQLQKIDSLISQKYLIYEKLIHLPNVHFKKYPSNLCQNVYTHLLFWFDRGDISVIVDQCNKEGLSLKPSWPTHQKLWKYQETLSVLRLKKSLLTYCVSPMLTNKEINHLSDILQRIE